MSAVENPQRAGYAMLLALGGPLGAGCGPRPHGLQRSLEQSAPAGLREDEHHLRSAPVALAQVSRSDELLLQRRNAVHLPDLRAALRLPLSEAPLRARRARRRRRSRIPSTSTRTARSSQGDAPGRGRRGDAIRHQAQTGHQVRAAPGVRQGRPGRVRLSQHEARGRRRQVQGHRLQGNGHARADRGRLRVRDQAPRHAAHQVAVVLDDGRLHRRPQGVRREDRRRRQGRCARAWRRPIATCRSSISASIRSRAPRRSTAHAAHPRDRQVSAVQVLAGDDVSLAHCRGKPRSSTRSPGWPRRTSRSISGRSVPARSCRPNTSRTGGTSSSAIRISAASRIRAKGSPATRRRAISPIAAR